MQLKKFKVVSLFSGAMGLDLGLHSTNKFDILACVEKEPAFCNTIRINQAAGLFSKQTKVIEADIHNLEPDEILKATNLQAGELDVLIGGPPCQAFSTAGKRMSVQDHRGTLLWRFLYFVEVLKPKFFLMENVRGLLSASLQHRKLADRPANGGPPLSSLEQAGSVIRRFATDLHNIPGVSYRVDCFEVNSVNYGAPQIRERVLFFGNKYNDQISFPMPTHANLATLQPPAELFSVPKKPWRTLRDAISDLCEESPEILDFSPRKKAYLDLIPEGGNWRCLPIELQKESLGKAYFAKGGRSGWWRRLCLDLPSPTLVTMPNHASTSLCHPVETRALSAREYARIQEFPDTWQISGTTAEKYAQIGNAVPLRLGTISGSLIAEALDKLSQRRFVNYEQEIDMFQIIYLQSHIRARKWYSEGESVLWSDGQHNEKATYAKPKTIKKTSVIGV